jgi:hypothetical protein
MAATSGAARVTIEQHPDGMAHTRSTIRTMARLAKAASHTYPIRNLATSIVKGVPSKQVRAELAALYRWVRDHIRYRFDPVGLEWVQSPERTVKEEAGDCDDMATLLAALAGSLGHRWRFRTVGPSPHVMKHVCAEAWDGDRWVTLDPVLEPPATTTAARSDVGAFGRVAPARASHIWDDGGDMLQGLGARSGRRRVHVAEHSRGWPLAGTVGNRGIALWEGELSGCRCLHVETPASLERMRVARRAGLSGTVSEAGRELWSWSAYYPSDPSRGWDAAGIPPVPAPAYRSVGSAGPIVFTAPAGEFREGLGYLGGMGELGDLGIGIFKKIGKAVSGAVKVVGKIPGVNLVTKVGASLIPGASLALDAAKKVGTLIGGKAKGSAAISAGADVAADAAVAASAVKDMLAPPPGCPGPAPASRGDIDQLAQTIANNARYCTKTDLAPLMMAIQDRNNKACAAQLAAARSTSAKQLAAAKSAAAAAQKKAVAAAKKLAETSAKKKAAKVAKRYASKIAKLNKRLAAFKAGKYPKGSRQKFDPATNTWKVYAPSKTKAQKSALHGLGFMLRPSLSFSLGALGDAKRTGPAALKAIADFMKRNKNQAPQIALPAIKAFQSDVGLKPDGIYGPNTRAALAWSLVRTDLPAVAKPFAKSKVTWKPPKVAAPVVLVKPPSSSMPSSSMAPSSSAPVLVIPAGAAPSAPIPIVPPAAAAAIIAAANDAPGVVDAPMLPTAGASSMLTPPLVRDAMAVQPVQPDPTPVPKGYVPVDRTSTDPKLPALATVPEHWIDVSGPTIVDASKKKKPGVRRSTRGGPSVHAGLGRFERGLMWAAVGYMLASSAKHRRAA